MVYLIIFTLITFILALALKLLITYFFIKLFNKEKSFWLIFKPILLYELGVFCFFIIDPVSLIYLIPWTIIPHVFLFPVYFLTSIIILFLIFKLIMQKFSLLDFKKALLVFLIMFIIITPFISYSKVTAELKMAERLSIFEEWGHEEAFPSLLFPEPRLKSPSEILLEKTDRLNDIFLQGELLKGLRSFLITI